MKSYKSFIAELLLALLLLTTIMMIGITEKNRFNSSSLEIKRAYEIGLYDGFYNTVKYIDSMNYFKLGDIRFTKPEVDKFLHRK